jgi:homoserine kinase
MTGKSVRVFAPASVSNLGSGFDVLGFAIDRPGDVVAAHRTRERGLRFSLAPGSIGVPATAKENVAAHVASLMLQEFKPPFGIAMILEKRMPVGSGLGSSAASSVAAAAAVNALLPKPLKKRDVLRFAVEGERKASGAPHADNAAPSLLGGVCLIRSYRPLEVISVPVKNSIVWAVVHPHLVVNTGKARRMLPAKVPLRSAVQQWGNVSGLTMGLMQGDVRLVGKCVEDVLIEPVRAKLIPGFQMVKRAALEAGAAGCSISGSGPSLFAVTGSRASAGAVGRAMAAAFRRAAGVECDVLISGVNMRGAEVIART